ncbi:oxygen-independent coproporphyrinogen III oxidase [Flavicella sediminum]|uniref:oxygen-independent coproporphyrinogen III oxidase n=1 Tax=Flavicella sediminum TaxID=2585141 RepID=UPI00111E5132|nr:oxygen-independent coproporphyrinogen III oxidase [Flavicella sediminum]
MNNLLIRKYNIPGPRYTSYPTVPFWNKEGIAQHDWLRTAKQSFDESNEAEGISLYIHLPFCESLCTFCACHKRITKRHEVENPYIEAVLKEWQLYVDLFEETPIIREIHLGGGTPTFFSAFNLNRLISGVLSVSKKHEKHEFSFEGHPNNTSKVHLQTLFDLGFTRVSFGVQDYNEKVQKAIHRMQPFENVKNVTEWAREIGYTSISHDLVFGLPFQTLEDVLFTIEKSNELRPDRIAFYSYAHVPWVKGVGQRGYDEKDLPADEVKRSLYETGKQLLEDCGYVEIGMDHFALKTDSLYLSTVSKKLHRNFMGYSANKTQLMVGLGMSSIADSWYSFAQNVKTVKEYQDLVGKGEFPVFKGHLLSPEDLIIRKHILNIMCHFETSWEAIEMQFPELQTALSRLEEMEKDGLLEIHENGLSVPEKARPFVRNICMAFDLLLQKNKPQTNLFSKTV